MTSRLEARPAPHVLHLPARSAVAGADVRRARHTSAALLDRPLLDVAAAGRVLARLRRLVVAHDRR